MRYVIYGIIVLIVLYMGRNYIRGWILDRKKRKKYKDIEVDSDLIYTPVLSSRTFNFSIEVTEVGEGKALLTVVKSARMM